MSAQKGVTVKAAHTEGRVSLVFTPDGSQVVTCGADTFVKVFDADNIGAEPRTIEHHDAAINTIAINPKGNHIATGTESHLVSYFAYPSCEFLKHLTRAQSPIQTVAFGPKGRMVAAGADDGVIRLVNTSVAQQVLLKGHTDAVLCVAYDPKGEYLASSSADGTVRIWDITDEPTTVKTVRVASRMTPGSAQRMRVAWHPSGDSLAVPHGSGVQILERGTWSSDKTLIGGHSKDVSLIAWSKNGQYLATAGLDRQIFVWQLSTSQDIDRHKADAVPTDLSWSPRDNALAFVDEAGEIGSWRAVVPSHLPAPSGDVATAAAADSIFQTVPAADADGAAAATGDAAPAATGAAEASTIFSLGEDSILESADDIAAAAAADEATATAASSAAGGGRRRLRKVAHDSDDGGFSDHDDDEAAEAALLAREIAKRGRGGVAATEAIGGGASASVRNAVAALAGGSGLGGAAPQPVVHSSATPAKNGRRFLLWNMTGMVLTRDENVFWSVEVEFNSTDLHRAIRLTDHYGFSMAALDNSAVMFASRSNNGQPSTIVYRPLASWAPNSEWQVQLDKGEEALAIAVGHKFAAIATSKRYLRILSHTGAQRALICTANPLVSLAASGGQLAVVEHAGRAAGSADQSLLLSLFDLRDTARPVRLSSAPLPLSEGATLEWTGFSETGVLATVDSAGIVRGCLRSYGFEWVPLLDCASVKKSSNEHHWVVGLTEKELLAVMCKGDDKYPATLPRPVVTPLALAMPLAFAEPAEPKAEKERLLSALMLNEYRSTAVDNGVDEDDAVQAELLKGFQKLDAAVLRLINVACKHERMARALDLITQLQLPKSLSAALRLANHYKQSALADRIGRLMEARFEDGVPEEDVEEAPKPPPRPVRPKAAPKEEAKEVEEETNGRDDDEEEAGNQEEGEAAARPPLNPFGAAAKASNGGKAVMAPMSGKETVKGPKRSFPVTAAAGGKKARK